ncbi:tRNA (N6-isopentenyl adenosine(37)-C2)-methylthiotransferase MiaB [Microgenomates group bacterium RBG_19FT_COMBO_39_10]|nr:MAG: tRNA (N6-isopentenyl adenosine(37)-C2)-methylthiotransferase MiaB [Microgenomates group bacterium RBG_19FT_COMBO_39_10]
MKYFIQTFGCQMNEADSERMAGVFEKKGYQLAKKIEEANVIVINTCSVRESAENRVFGLINNLNQQRKKNQKIILTGCMLGSALGERRRYTLRQLKRKLPQVNEFKTIEELIASEKVEPKRKKKNSALISIMEGCDHFCSYCVVPYARGKEISRPFKEIITEVENLVKQGYQEVILLGQNVNSYQPNFAKLLKGLHETKGIKKISFLTSNPWDLTDEIIEAMSLAKVSRELHLPVQSGDNQILKKMNRPYTVSQYLKLVEKIKKKIPNIQISTDIIVGFPGETKKAFKNTVKLCQKVGFVKAYIAKYSPRPGTAAFKLKDNVSSEEKKRRWQILEKLINQKTKV